MIRRTDVTRSTRMAGQVTRYHTWPTLQQQSVGEHTFQVLRIYTEIFGPPPPHVTVYILRHDMEEVATGDAPFPIKRDNPDIAAGMTRAGEEALAEMVKLNANRETIPVTPDVVDDRHKAEVKLCDLIEMLEFGMEEVTLGNQYGRPVMSDISEAINSIMMDRLEMHSRAAASNYLGRIWDRYRRINHE